jgi:hypothetical protein
MAVDGAERGVDAVRSWASAQARWLAKWENLPPGLERFEEEMARAADAYDFQEHLSLSAEHAGVISDDLAASLAVAGDVDECARRISDIADLGADRVTIALLSGGRDRRLLDLLEVWETVHGTPAATRGTVG